MLAATLGLFLFGPAMASGTDVSQPPKIPDACGSEKYQIMVGKTGHDVEGIGVEPPMRIIPYGNFVTLEFVPDRINFRLDERGLVVRVYCG